MTVELIARPDWSSLRLADEGLEEVNERRYRAAKAELDAFRALHGITRPLEPIMGGAEIFPDEGLDFIIDATFRRGATATVFPDPCWLGLYVNGGAVTGPTTVPARTAVLATQTGVTEAAGGGYERVPVPSSAWPVPTTSGAGRRTTVAAPGIAFPETTDSFTDPDVQGFFVATAKTGGRAIFYANFDSGKTLRVNQAGFVVRIPPFAQLDG